MSSTPATAEWGTPVAGPSALGTDFRRFLYLSYTLAVTDFRMRFFGSVLGYLWQLFRPLLLFGVLYVVFTRFARLGNDIPHYPVVLLENIVLYTFFAEATANSVSAVVDRENLVRKIHFPRLAIPLSVLLTALFNLALNLVVVLIFALASGVEPRWSWLELPLIVIGMSFWIAGIAMLLSSLYVRFRDVRPVWEVTLQALFYLTPVIYPLELIPNPSLEKLVAHNPLAVFLQQARHAVIDPGAASAAAAVGGWKHMLFPAALVVLTVVIGFWYFNREAPRIAEEL